MSKPTIYKAEYYPCDIPDYQGNPLIEALPPLSGLGQAEVIKKLSNYPSFDESERLLDRNTRLHMIQRIFQLFQPMTFHLDLESRISRLIRQSYEMRNPLLKHGELSTNSMLNGFSYLGISGMGKSSSINTILNRIYEKQVILHGKYEYEGAKHKLAMYQVVWIKLEATDSLKALALEFFMQVDSLLGADYAQKFGSQRRSVGSMLPAMATVAKQINLGLLIIDEIQAIRTLRTNADRILNFFVSLTNTIGIPVVMIGTPSSVTLFREFKFARRASGMGDLIVDRLTEGVDWDLLTEALSVYQFTKNEIKMSEIKSTLLNESQGIIDVAIKLYALSQSMAIRTGKETVDSALIKEVSRTHFKLIKKYIDALKSGNLRSIAQFEDISTLMIDAETTIEKISSQAEIEQRVRELKKAQAQRASVDTNLLRTEALGKLELLGKRFKKTERILDQILSVPIEGMTANDLAMKVLELSIKDAKSINEETKTKVEGDIRVLISKGKEEGLSAYDSIKHSGLIKSMKLGGYIDDC